LFENVTSLSKNKQLIRVNGSKGYVEIPVLAI
jgi:hypothetical protein